MDQMLNDVMEHSNATIDTLMSGNSNLSANIKEEKYSN